MLTLLLLKSREVIAIRPLLVLGAKVERFFTSASVSRITEVLGDPFQASNFEVQLGAVRTR